MEGVDKFGRQLNYTEALEVVSNEITPLLATKLSIDGSDSMGGNLNMSGHNITNLPVQINQLAGNSSACSYEIALELIQGEDSIVVHKAGDTMYGNLLMGGNLVRNLIDPVALSDAATKGYIDALLQYKLNKTGGAMSGNLAMSGYFVNNIHDPILPQDAASKNYVDVINNLAVYKAGDTMSGNLNLDGNYITNMPDPIVVGDGANKRYVDNQSGVKKCYSGYVPELISNVNKSGFVASSSSSYGTGSGYIAANAFRLGTTAEWATASFSTNFWIKIKCPELVRVWRIALSGRNSAGERIYNWKFQGSIDDITWDDLYVAPSTFLGYTNQLFNISTTSSYNYYRIYANQGETTNPGLSYWQLYVYSN
mgnify:CR=1 FL=1